MWRGDYSKGPFIVLLGVALLTVSCAGTGGSGARAAGDSGAQSSTSSTNGGTATSPSLASDCGFPAGEPFLESQSVELGDLGKVDGVGVRGAAYPHPDHEGNPWSQWGQGIVVDDGRYYSAIGDHLAEDGNSYLYEYDPASGTLTMIGDVLSYVDHVPGTWGYGKIHGQMVPGPCGEVYFSTYWGSYRDIEFEGSYEGDILFRLDPSNRTLRPLGVPVEHHGQASLGSAPEYGLVYGEAADPLARAEGIKKGPLFAYDVINEEVAFVGPDNPHTGYRSILVDAEGVAYYSIGGGELAAYDPETGETHTHEAKLPGDWLRAVTSVGPDGSVYGVTREPDTFFAMRPDGSIERLGNALGYTASMALSPDGSTFYYMPGAHGNSVDWNSPLVAVDTATGEERVVAELHDVVESGLGYNLGGTYNVAVSADGGTVFIGANVGLPGTEEGFGEVILLTLELR